MRPHIPCAQPLVCLYDTIFYISGPTAYSWVWPEEADVFKMHVQVGSASLAS